MNWENILKAKLKAVRTERYETYVKFIKKVLKDEGGAVGMQGFIDASEELENFDEEYLNYVIDDAIDHYDWLRESEYGDFILEEE